MEGSGCGTENQRGKVEGERLYIQCHSLANTLIPMQAIEHDHRDVSGPCYTALLETWLTQAPTLGALMEALESPVIGHGDITRNIEHTVLKLK